jgi:3-oxoacyl-[acyl-carrier protein] reductase
MDLGLKGKTALVTGSSRGLGFATARLLAVEGANVAVNSRSPEKAALAAQQITASLQNTPGNTARIIGVAGDVTRPEAPEEIVRRTAQELGGLDLLVTNAGGPPAGSFESFDDAAWYQAIEASLLSHVRLIRAALPYLRQSASPSVLTITSYSVKQPVANLVLSNSIRAATVGLTKTLALELGREQIRFNSILPAAIQTERIEQLISTRALTNGTSVEEEKRKQAQESPLGRIGTPDEFARAAVFLLSPAASFITGVMLTVDGGMYKGTL